MKKIFLILLIGFIMMGCSSKKNYTVEIGELTETPIQHLQFLEREIQTTPKEKFIVAQHIFKFLKRHFIYRFDSEQYKYDYWCLMPLYNMSGDSEDFAITAKRVFQFHRWNEKNLKLAHCKIDNFNKIVLLIVIDGVYYVVDSDQDEIRSIGELREYKWIKINQDNTWYKIKNIKELKVQEYN